MIKCHHKNIVGLYEDGHVIDCIYRVLNNHYAPPSLPYEKIVPPTILYQMKAREKLHLGVQLEKVQFVKLLQC